MRVARVPTQFGIKDSIKAYEWNEFPFDEVKTERLRARKKKGPATYCKAFGAFDIESTTIQPRILGYNGQIPIYEFRPWGFMYHWQMCVDGICVYGRHWTSWIEFLKMLVEHLHISKDNVFVIYVHNLGYEFQFMAPFLRKYFGELEVFASHSRKPMHCRTSNGIEFRCSYFLSNMSLYKAVTNELGVVHIKAKDDLDYKKLRTPDTPLDDVEFGYCIGDVISLWEYIQAKLKNENDSIESIPLTSTGYVRRDCRNSCKKSKKYRYRFLKQRMTPTVYTLLNEASRGGNTHACRWMSGRVWHDVHSYDEQSAYPGVQLRKKFPCTKFFVYGQCESMEELHKCMEEFCCLFRVHFNGLRLKERVPMPYIPISKALYFPKGVKNDNGRVLEAEVFSMTVTEIDMRIIEEQYEWDNIAISDLHVARKDYLPEELAQVIKSYFIAKCELKYKIAQAEATGEDPEEIANLKYLYMKSKNRLNGIFGMSFTNPINSETSIDDKGQWTETRPSGEEAIQEALDKYYGNRNSFMYYAVGVWTTAHARAELQNLIDVTSRNGGECIYCDTDSSKCLNPDVEAIEELNRKIIAEDEERGAYAEVNGVRYYLGIYEDETEKEVYSDFITLGAKKYAYVDSTGLHTTISGVSKSGTKEMKNGIKDFKVGFQFKESAGSTLYYNDEQEIREVEVAGSRFLTASNIGMIDSTYTLGITTAYAEIINYNIEVEDLFDENNFYC